MTCDDMRENTNGKFMDIILMILKTDTGIMTLGEILHNTVCIAEIENNS